jgi:hypothetical protein
MAGYSRTNTADIQSGQVVKSAPINAELNAIVTAFAFSGGHNHDGSSTEGAYVGLIADTDALNKVVVDTSNNRVGFFTEVSSAATEQIRIQDGAILPVTDNDIDLGASGTEFKDLHIDGTAHIDTLDVDENATVAGTLGVTGAVTANAGVVVDNITIDGTEIDLSSGDLTIDVAGDIILDADGADVLLKDAGTQYAALTNSSGNLIIKSGSTTALTFSGANVTAAGEVSMTTLDIGGTNVTATATELNILDGVTATTAELNIMDGVTATTAELNIMDGVTSTAAELNILDGVTATTAELNIMDGVTATTAELNIMDGVTATASEINIIDGDTSATSTTVADADRVILNDNGTMVQVAVTDLAAYFDDEITAMPNLVTTAATTVGTLDSGAISSGFGNIDTGSSTITTTGLITGGSLDIDDVVINGTTIGHTDDTDLITLANGSVTIAGDLTVSGTQTVVDTVTMNAQNAIVFEGATADANETTLTIVDPTADRTINLPNQSGTIPVLAAVSTTQITSTPEELNILDGVTATTAELNILDGVTSTAAELNILDGVTATATEINILDGDTSASSVTVADADRVVLNDNGTMKQVAVTDLSAYFDDEITAMPNLVTTAATTVGALDSGSITSGFGSINNGSSAITTTGTITYGSLSDGSITITGFVDEDDMSSNSATLIPTQQSVEARIQAVNGTANNVSGLTATGAELNVLDGASAGTIVNSKGVIYSSGGKVNATSLQIAGTDLTATAAEFNLLDGGSTVGTTSVAGGDGILTNDGGTMRQTSVDTFDTYLAGTTKTLTNKTLTAPKFADGGFIADANGNELIMLQTASSAVNQLEVTNAASGGSVVVGASGDDSNIDIDISPKGTGEVNIAAGNLNYGGTAVTATGAELNLTDGSSSGTIVNSKAVIYGGSGEVNATTLQIAGSSITATAAELNIMDGDTSASSTTLVDADRLVTNDAGTMKQVALTDLQTYLSSAGFATKGFATAMAIAL